MNLKAEMGALQKWKNQLATLWPAAKGYLGKVYKPCIRKNCPACARGDKHPAWMLSFTIQGRRKTMYVPLALVPELKRALQNGRTLETLLYQIGPQLILSHRQTVKKSSKRPPKS